MVFVSPVIGWMANDGKKWQSNKKKKPEIFIAKFLLNYSQEGWNRQSKQMFHDILHLNWNESQQKWRDQAIFIFPLAAKQQLTRKMNGNSKNMQI